MEAGIQERTHLSPYEQAKIGFDNGEDIYIRKLNIAGNTPQAIDLEIIKKLALQDKEYQEALTGVKNGKKSKNRKFSQVWGDIHSEQGLLLKGHTQTHSSKRANQGYRS